MTEPVNNRPILLNTLEVDVDRNGKVDRVSVYLNGDELSISAEMNPTSNVRSENLLLYKETLKASYQSPKLLAPRPHSSNLNIITFPGGKSLNLDNLYTQAVEANELKKEGDIYISKAKQIEEDLKKNDYPLPKKIETLRQLSIYITYVQELSELYEKQHTPSPMMQKAVTDLSKQSGLLREGLYFDGGTDEKGSPYGLYAIYKKAYEEVSKLPKTAENKTTEQWLDFHLAHFKNRGAETKQNRVERQKTVEELKKIVVDLEEQKSKMEQLPRDYSFEIPLDDFKKLKFLPQEENLKTDLIKAARRASKSVVIIDNSNHYPFMRGCNDPATHKKFAEKKLEIYAKVYKDDFVKFVESLQKLAYLAGKNGDILAYTLGENHEYKTVSEVHAALEIIERDLTQKFQKRGFKDLDDSRLAEHLTYFEERKEEVKLGFNPSEFLDYLGYKPVIEHALKLACFYLSGNGRKVNYSPYTREEIEKDPDLKRFLKWNITSIDPKAPIPIYKIYYEDNQEVLSSSVIDIFQRFGKKNNHPVAFSLRVPKENGATRLITVLSLGLENKPDGKFAADYEVSNFFHELGHVITFIASSQGIKYPEFLVSPNFDVIENWGRLFEIDTYTPLFAESLIHYKTKQPAPTRIKERWVSYRDAAYGPYYNLRGLRGARLNMSAYANPQAVKDQPKHQILETGYFAAYEIGDGYQQVTPVYYGKKISDIGLEIQKKFPGEQGREKYRDLLYRYFVHSNQGTPFRDLYQEFEAEVQRLGVKVDTK